MGLNHCRYNASWQRGNGHGSALVGTIRSVRVFSSKCWDRKPHCWCTDHGWRGGLPIIWRDVLWHLWLWYVHVLLYRDFLKWGYPQSSPISMGCSNKPSIFGRPPWNPPAVLLVHSPSSIPKSWASRASSRLQLQHLHVQLLQDDVAPWQTADGPWPTSTLAFFWGITWVEIVGFSHGEKPSTSGVYRQKYWWIINLTFGSAHGL